MNQEVTRIQHTPTDRAFTVLLSPTRRGARLARLLTTAHLGAWGLPSESAAHIVDHWGIVPGPVPRKTVWAEIDLVR
ncbi:hypothetical protein ACWGQ9_16675 [Streptomyces parvus]